MENIYNKLRFRGYSFGVGVGEKVEKKTDITRLTTGAIGVTLNM